MGIVLGIILILKEQGWTRWRVSLQRTFEEPKGENEWDADSELPDSERHFARILGARQWKEWLIDKKTKTYASSCRLGQVMDSELMQFQTPRLLGECRLEKASQCSRGLARRPFSLWSTGEFGGRWTKYCRQFSAWKFWSRRGWRITFMWPWQLCEDAKHVYPNLGLRRWGLPLLPPYTLHANYVFQLSLTFFCCPLSTNYHIAPSPWRLELSRSIGLFPTQVTISLFAVSGLLGSSQAILFLFEKWHTQNSHLTRVQF